MAENKSFCQASKLDISSFQVLDTDALFLAAFLGNSSEIVRLLQKGVPVNAKRWVSFFDTISHSRCPAMPWHVYTSSISWWWWLLKLNASSVGLWTMIWCNSSKFSSGDTAIDVGVRAYNERHCITLTFLFETREGENCLHNVLTIKEKLDHITLSFPGNFSFPNPRRAYRTPSEKTCCSSSKDLMLRFNKPRPIPFRFPWLPLRTFKMVKTSFLLISLRQGSAQIRKLLLSNELKNVTIALRND